MCLGAGTPLPPALATAGWCLACLLLLRLLLGALGWLLRQRRGRTVRTMVVLGSGGHTAEMLSLLRGFDLQLYTPRCYVVAATDAMSRQKAVAFEAAVVEAAAAATDVPALPSPPKPGRVPRRTPRKQQAQQVQQATAPTVATKQGQAQQGQQQQYSVVSIPRSREVGQSFRSSVGTTLRALRFAVWVALGHRPDLLLLNGPGTCIPVAAAVLLARALGLARGRVVYVESIARVYRLSLSGKLLYHLRLADRFLVQWEELQRRHPRALYAGRLM